MDLLRNVFYNNAVFSCNVLNVNILDCVSMNKQECEIKSEIINVNSNESSFRPYSIKINKFSGSCNSINDPYAILCAPDAVKNKNVKAFNLILKANETRPIE